jgi:hypothetical protein
VLQRPIFGEKKIISFINKPYPRPQNRVWRRVNMQRWRSLSQPRHEDIFAWQWKPKPPLVFSLHMSSPELCHI